MQHGRPGFRTLIMILIALMLIFPMLAPGCSSSDEEGESAPVFTLDDLDGNQISLTDFQGKVVFLTFWAMTCSPCKEEMPDMETLYQEYKDQNVAVISITLPGNDDDVPQFVEDNGYSWTFVLDKTGAVANKYEIKYTPTSFFIDIDGIIRVVKVGGMSYDTMKDNLIKTINKE